METLMSLFDGYDVVHSHEELTAWQNEVLAAVDAALAAHPKGRAVFETVNSDLGNRYHASARLAAYSKTLAEFITGKPLEEAHKARARAHGFSARAVGAPTAHQLNHLVAEALKTHDAAKSVVEVMVLKDGTYVTLVKSVIGMTEFVTGHTLLRVEPSKSPLSTLPTDSVSVRAMALPGVHVPANAPARTSAAAVPKTTMAPVAATPPTNPAADFFAEIASKDEQVAALRAQLATASPAQKFTISNRIRDLLESRHK